MRELIEVIEGNADSQEQYEGVSIAKLIVTGRVVKRDGFLAAS